MGRFVRCSSTYNLGGGGDVSTFAVSSSNPSTDSNPHHFTINSWDDLLGGSSTYNLGGGNASAFGIKSSGSSLNYTSPTSAPSESTIGSNSATFDSAISTSSAMTSTPSASASISSIMLDSIKDFAREAFAKHAKSILFESVTNSGRMNEVIAKALNEAISKTKNSSATPEVTVAGAGNDIAHDVAVKAGKDIAVESATKSHSPTTDIADGDANARSYVTDISAGSTYNHSYITDANLSHIKPAASSSITVSPAPANSSTKLDVATIYDNAVKAATVSNTNNTNAALKDLATFDAGIKAGRALAKSATPSEPSSPITDSGTSTNSLGIIPTCSFIEPNSLIDGCTSYLNNPSSAYGIVFAAGGGGSGYCL